MKEKLPQKRLRDFLIETTHIYSGICRLKMIKINGITLNTNIEFYLTLDALFIYNLLIPIIISILKYA